MIEDTIYDYLTTNAGVSALVGTKVYLLQQERETSFPCIVFSRVSTTRSLFQGNDNNTAEARFQFDCLASTITEAKQLARALRLAMQGYSSPSGSEPILRAQVVNEIDLLDEDLGAQVSVDILVFYIEV